MQIQDACDSYISLNNTSFQCWLRINTGFHVFPRGPHVAWQQQLLINICCLWPSSAANPLAAAINWWDRQTDGAQLNWDTHTHSRLMALCPGLPGSAGTRKVKPIWILLKQETVSGSGISCTICKSAPRSRQTTTPAPHHSVFFKAVTRIYFQGCWGLSAGYQPRPQVVDRGTTARYGGQLRYI